MCIDRAVVKLVACFVPLLNRASESNYGVERVDG